jgi:hypothetical protein
MDDLNMHYVSTTERLPGQKIAVTKVNLLKIPIGKIRTFTRMAFPFRLRILGLTTLSR